MQRAIILTVKSARFLRTTKNYSTEPSIKKSVLISQSKDIYTNLALQDWIYQKFDLSKNHIMMLWQNEPCVTIGKNGNPWLDVNVEHLPYITETGVKLARQNTDGSSMYQDGGNLNITFFAPKDRLNEGHNMEVVSRALYREYSLKTEKQNQEFTLRNNYNISESTKKVGTTNAYHHCNLFVKVNKSNLTESLMKQEIGIENQSSPTCKIMSICDDTRQVDVRKLLKAVGWEYMRTPAIGTKDGGKELASHQKGFQMINPTENWFPGINDIRENFSEWSWLYGKTPSFKVAKSIHVHSNIENVFGDLNMNLSVKGGIIKDITLSIPSHLSAFKEDVRLITETLIGHKFSVDLLNNLQESIKNLVDDKEKFVWENFRQVMSSF